MNIAKGGFPWVISSLLITLFFIIASFVTVGLMMDVTIVFSVVFFMKSCLLLLFFRDPDRTIGVGIVAVADGKIREILQMHDADVGECTLISTFMNIQNVHVNRMPLDGTIKKITYHKGRHLPAFQKESERNERVVLLIRTDIGMIKIIQIAGTVARRIVPYVTQGKQVKKGEMIGLIRLGSRVDVYLPTTKIKAFTIQVNDKVKAGEDTIAEIYD
jgi:phosphatidylserine decarboxylase